MKFLTAFFFTLFLALPVFADTMTCPQKVLDRHYHSVAIIKAMADYKAAMDAGFKGCAAIHKDEFAGKKELQEFWGEKTDAELHEAFDVFTYIAATQNLTDETDEVCVEDAVADLIDFAGGQYEKSYDRRYKMLKDSNVDLDFKTNDSCQWVLESMKKYNESFENQPALRHILFRIASGHSQLSETADRKQKKAFKNFAKTRDKLTTE